MSHGGARRGAGRRRLPEARAAARTIDDRVTLVRRALTRAGLENDYQAIRLYFISKTRQKVGAKAAKLVRKYARVENDAKEALEALHNRPEKVSRENALLILLHVDLSRQQYQTLRTLINSASKIKNLLPHYELVRLYKVNCSPNKDPALYKERRAEVKLQELLNHTAERAVLSNKDDINELASRRRGPVDCEFLITWGMDGASEQSQYQQKHMQRENIGKPDNSLFAVVVNPVKLETARGVRVCLWKNPAVQSYLFIRPLVLEFEKESQDYVMRMKAYIDAQIEGLQPIIIELDGGKVLRIRFKMLASMIDGKIFCFFVSKATTSCPVCAATNRDLERYTGCIGTRVFWPFLEALIYGLQVLHAWINFTNHLINLAQRMARDEAIRDAEDANLPDDECKRIGKEAWSAKLAQIQHDFLQHDLHLGLTVNGNMARTLLGPKRDLFEAIVGIDRRIIDRFRIILICINTTRYYLKPVEFQNYCDETRDLYLSLYPQYPMTPTIHKVLEHSVQIQDATGQILGEVSEGAAEAKHRIRKQIRRYRARKTSKKDNLTDVMDRCLHLSDPKLSMQYSTKLTMYRNKRREHALGQIPVDAQNLLVMTGKKPPRVTYSVQPSPGSPAAAPARGRRRRDAPDHNHPVQEEDNMEVSDSENHDPSESEVEDSDPSDGEVDFTETDDEVSVENSTSDTSDLEDIFVDE